MYKSDHISAARDIGCSDPDLNFPTVSARISTYLELDLDHAKADPRAQRRRQMPHSLLSIRFNNRACHIQGCHTTPCPSERKPTSIKLHWNSEGSSAHARHHGSSLQTAGDRVTSNQAQRAPTVTIAVSAVLMS